MNYFYSLLFVVVCLIAEGGICFAEKEVDIEEISQFEEKILDKVKKMLDQQEKRYLEKVQKMDAEIQRLDEHTKEAQSSFIAFTAKAPETIEYEPGDVIQFSEIITNYGDMYDASTYSFTCPIDGYYLFTATMQSSPDSRMRFSIEMDSEKLVWGEAFGTETVDSGTVTSVNLCPSNSQVWVTCNGTDTYTDINYPNLSFFTGTLLRVV